MLFDEQSNQVRLTKTELNRIRKNAARNGYTVNQITSTEQLDEALVHTCTTNQLQALIDKIQAHSKALK